MMKKTLLFAAALVFASTTVSSADGIRIPIPPVPPLPPVPRESRVVLPPPPPTVSVKRGEPEDWFWDDGREVWFYYDVDRRPVYVKRHIYVDDGRHYYVESGKWRVGRGDMGRHKGWYKHRDRHEKGEWRKGHRKHKHGRGRWED